MRAEPGLRQLAFLAARLEDAFLQNSQLEDLVADGYGSSFPTVTVVVGGSTISGSLIGPRAYGQLVREWAEKHALPEPSLGVIRGAFADVGPLPDGPDEALDSIHSVYFAGSELVRAGSTQHMPPMSVPLSAVDAWCLGAPGNR